MRSTTLLMWTFLATALFATRCDKGTPPITEHATTTQKHPEEPSPPPPSTPGTSDMSLTSAGSLEPVKTLGTGHDNTGWHVFDLVFSRDGQLIALAVSDGTVRLMRTSQGTPLLTLAPPAPDAEVTALAFSPDSALIAIGSWEGDNISRRNPMVRILDVTSGQEVGRLKGDWVPGLDLIFSTDATSLLVGGADVRRWDVATGEPVGEPYRSQHERGHKRSVQGLVWSSADRWIAGINDSPIVHSSEPDGSHVYRGSDQKPNAIVAWRTDNAISKIYSGSNIAQPRGGDGGGEPLRVLGSHPANPDAVVVAYDRTPHIRVIALDTGEVLWHADLGTTRADAAAFSPDGSRLAVAGQDSLLVFDPSQEAAEPLRLGTATCRWVGFSADGERLFCWAEGLRTWDLRETPARLEPIEGQGESIVRLLWSGPNTLVSMGASSLAYWDVETGRMTSREQLPIEGSLIDVRLDAAGLPTELVKATSTTVTVRELSTGKERQIEVSSHYEAATALSPDGAVLALGHAAGRVELFDVEAGAAEPRGHYIANKERITRLRFSNDGSQLASGSSYGDGDVVVWDLTTNQEFLRFKVDAAGPRDLQFSADGRWLAAVDSRWVRVASLAQPSATPKVLEQWDDARNAIVALSPDGRRLVVASAEARGVKRSMNVYDLESGQLHVALADQDGLITSLAFSEDGQMLAAALGGSVVKVWDLSETAPR